MKANPQYTQDGSNIVEVVAGDNSYVLFKHNKNEAFALGQNKDGKLEVTLLNEKPALVNDLDTVSTMLSYATYAVNAEGVLIKNPEKDLGLASTINAAVQMMPKLEAVA